ncbi:DUF1835 domain-containing protein [Enterobacter cloacae]|uniref:DUF1835 domain-containing protein n=1 Tax=Enterobacter cloacae TaxID=550 RepID=UPI002A440115|nr:DUF1835 domain-containing protein [Enterobacter cloacae]
MVVSNHSTRFRHICWGDAAAGLIKMCNTLSNKHEEVLAFVDDFRFGDLSDASQALNHLRILWFRRITRAQWWYNEKEYELFLMEHWKQRHLNILHALSTDLPIIVWIGNSARERLMLAMLTNYVSIDTKIFIADISKQVNLMYPGMYEVSMCQPKQLLKIFPVEMDCFMRLKFSLLWEEWRNKPIGWRYIATDDRIVACDENHFDSKLLSHMSYNHPISADIIISAILTEELNNTFVSAEFLYWRLNILRNNRKVLFASGNEQYPSPPLILLY